MCVCVGGGKEGICVFVCINLYHIKMLVSDLIYPLRISLYVTCVISNHYFLYSSADVYKMAENVYPVNKNVTIDGRGKGTIIGHKNIFFCDQFIKYYMLGLFSDSEKTIFFLCFVM